MTYRLYSTTCLRALTSALIGVAGLALSAPAAAQDAAAPVDTAAAGSHAAVDGGLADIVVTARRREENLMRTPVSVTAFTGEELERRQIGKSDEIGRFSPNVEFRSQANASSGNNNAIVFVRGIGQSDFVPSVEPGVGIYVDEAYLAGVAGAVIGLADIESIEVLRGPQGTLFGRNTIGGAVLINTVKPKPGFEGTLDVAGGTDNYLMGRLTLNVPLADNLYSRLTLLGRQRDGWVKYVNMPGSRGGGSEETKGARLALRWEPSSSVTIDLAADYTTSTSAGPPQIHLFENRDYAPDGTTLTTVGEYNQLVQPFYGGPLIDNSYVTDLKNFVNHGTQFDGSKQDIWGLTLTTLWELGGANLKTITNYRNVQSRDGRDEDGTPIDNVNHIRDIFDGEQWSQEIQLSGSGFDRRLDWTIGAYYAEDSTANINPIDFSLLGLTSGSIVKKKSAALFGQATYDLTDKLSFTAGLRYTNEKKDFIVDDRIQYVTRVWGPMIGAPAGFVTLPPNAFKLAANGVTKANAEVVDHYYNLSYQITDDAMVYASYSTGFKGGGFVQRIIPGAVVTAFEPEFAKVYELGFKLQGLDNRVRLTGAAFFTDYTDMQIVVQRGVAPATENAGDAEIRGFELEAVMKPSRTLQISGGLGYLKAKYTKLDPTATIPITNKLPSTPNWQFNLAAYYTVPTPVFDGELGLRADYSWSDAYFLNAENDVLQKQRPYGLLNAAISWVDASGQLELGLQGKNLTNKAYLTSPQLAINIQGQVAPTVGQDRQFTVNAKYRF